MKALVIASFVTLLILAVVFKDKLFGYSGESEEEEEKDPNTGKTATDTFNSIDDGLNDLDGKPRDYAGNKDGKDFEGVTVVREMGRESEEAQGFIKGYIAESKLTHGTGASFAKWIRSFRLGKDLYSHFPNWDNRNVTGHTFNFNNYKREAPAINAPEDHLFFTPEINEPWYEKLDYLNSLEIAGKRYEGGKVKGFIAAYTGIGVAINAITGGYKKKQKTNPDNVKLFKAFDFRDVGGTCFFPDWSYVDNHLIDDKSAYGKKYSRYRKNYDGKMPELAKDLSELRDKINLEAAKFYIALEDQAIKSINEAGIIKIKK